MRNNGHNGHNGFTLIELIVAVAIVGILAAIAYPSYQEYVRKGERANGAALLLEVAQRLERCYTRFNSYDNAGCAVATQLGGAGVSNNDAKYTVTATALGANSYTLLATATGSQAGDANCGNYTLTSTNVKGVSGAKGVDYCW